MTKNPFNKLIVILGPTASGKTDLAVKLAKRFNAEIVCADSRQIYSEMPIGTASPIGRGLPPATIPHHLFGITPPKKVFSAGQFQKLAIKTIKDIQKRGKVPFLVGGSAFYIYPVIEGWRFPKLSANQKLRQELERKTTKQLFAMLKTLSPIRAKNIDRNNKRRLIRAIEIAKEVGEVPKIIKKPIFDCLILGINPNKGKLKKRIEARTTKMLKMGLEKEVKNLVKKYGWTDVLKNTIGYAEWSSFAPTELRRDKTKIEKLLVLHTLQLAKRQMTWFKKDKRIHWIKNQQQAANLTKKFTERIPL